MKKFKKLAVLTLLSFLLSNNLFAHGKNDVEDIQVDNMNSWQEEFDLEQKKPGKYNIMITARDLGGNTYIEGPHNLYLDPESDLPICGITNPYPNMRVVGNLNIVGTCVDDDGVSRVELILDEGAETEKHVTAEGKEFWSYYLDTNKLEEGPHTIKVIGYDINDEPVEGHPTTMTWQLDRKQPLTQVLDKAMGILVSGKVNFDGIVTDGNGIKSLEYSVDNGQFFTPVKIPKNKDLVDFTVSIDTRKFEDGPAVLWFRATDWAGSVGLYSFLYFIDNTKPDVAVVSPAEDEIVNGRFTVAGYAKDKIGVTQLTWSFGDQTGEFELIPGNPYWSLTLDTIGSKDKGRKFSLHAVDRANNVTDISRTIALNQEDDKPVVTTTEPVAGQIITDKDMVFVRGIVNDDDAVQSVKIQLDSDEPIIQETKGVYYYDLIAGKDLSVGKHKITISGIDVNGVEGNPVVTEIVSMGFAPEFVDPVITVGKESTPFENGMEVHPESGSVFGVTANSEIGIKHVHTELTWGKVGKIENDLDLKNVLTYNATLPIVTDSPKGVLRYSVKVTDTIDRVSEYSAFIYVTNTSKIKNDDPIIVFDDSTIAEDGSIINNAAFPATGYVLGGKPVSVEIVPETPFAKAKLVGNQIQLIPGKEIGASEPVVVKITTDKGKVAESRPLVFKNDTALPVIKLSGVNDMNAVDGRSGKVKASGKITCKTGVGPVKYRVLAARATVTNTVVSKVIADPVVDEFQPLTLGEEGNFELNLNTADWGEGMFVVEIIAESAGGNPSAAAFAVSTIPDIEEVNGKMPSAKAPVITFLDGFDVYGVATAQSGINRNFQIFPRSEMVEGSNDIAMEITDDAGKVISGKYKANKAPSLQANFALVNGETYYSGMPVVIPYATKAAGTVSIFIDTGATVNSVSYNISGAEVPGGDLTQSGSAKLIKPTEEDPMRWIAEIPLGNLPSRVTKIDVTVKAGSLEQQLSGSVSVIRENASDIVEDVENFYGLPAVDTVFDKLSNAWILGNGSVYYFYTNYTTPIKAELVGVTDELKVSVNGKLVTIAPVKDGKYDDVSVKITDRFGDIYESEKLNFIADSSNPVLNVQTPEFKQWLGSEVHISGTAADPLGIRSVEYSTDNGGTWQKFELGLPAVTNDAGETVAVEGDKALGVTYSQDLSLATMPDGLIKIDVRATDNSGHATSFTTSCYKDTTPPEVNVVVPLDVDVINGETLIVFDAKDNAFLNKAEYIAPPAVTPTAEEGAETPTDATAASAEPAHYNIDMEPLISTFVGTEKCPNEESMSFRFTDDAGNFTTLEAWKFSIDNESDLPVSEIHVPEDMQVITRDFTISGVIYDDDGDTTIFYKIDDEEYHQIAQMGTSFAIDVPLSSMTDNEHTVTVYAVDINGVKGYETSRTFRISLEEPKGAVELPTIDTSVREMVTISGWASDKNGISKVEISLDNGCSYNDAVGAEEWSYTVDSRAIPGGTQVVFLRVTDGYGIQGLYSSLINIDNDAPNLNLELPLDDTTTTGQLFFSGYTYDNVEVTELYLSIRNLEQTTDVVTIPITIDRIIGQTIDMRDFENGFYNVELTGKDKAGNITNVSRNIHLDKDRPPATVDILYPLNGEHKQGVFTIYGQSSSEAKIKTLKLYVDEKLTSETEITECGFFKFDMGPENITEGVHVYRVDALLDNGMQVPSRDQTITYKAIGPWVTIDNFTYGDFAVERPYLRGQAGYSIAEDELLLSKTKEATPEFKAMVAAKKVAKVEISFDNGKTFTLLSNSEKWMYRIENQDMPEGYHFFLIRATMMNGETAITRTIIQIDNTHPSVKLIAPSIGGRYNQSLLVSGLSNDDVRLEDVTVTLRKGDKASYEVPSFIQGLYLDFHFWGATLFDLGVGLTAFDDAVKLQASWGQFTQAQRNAASDIFGVEQTDLRYGGENVFSFKLLANIYSLPFSYLFGHDWDWLYAQVALGAQFSLFDQTGSGKPQILSAALAQIEFPKIKLQNVKAFSTFSFYTEGSMWFIPTDVSSKVEIQNIVYQIAIGARINIF